MEDIRLCLETKMDLIKIEVSHLHEWFDKYDRLLIHIRGWLVTIFLAVLGFAISKLDEAEAEEIFSYIQQIEELGEESESPAGGESSA